MAGPGHGGIGMRPERDRDGTEIEQGAPRWNGPPSAGETSPAKTGRRPAIDGGVEAPAAPGPPRKPAGRTAGPVRTSPPKQWIPAHRTIPGITLHRNNDHIRRRDIHLLGSRL